MGYPYVSHDDLRAATALYPYLVVPTVPNAQGGTISDLRLDAMGSAASDLIDAYCHDHFAPTTGGTVTVYGDDSGFLRIPRRIRSVSSVTVLDYAGSTTAITTAYYRVESSFSDLGLVVNEAGQDGLALLQTLPVVGPWPASPYTIRVVGDFDWLTTPEAVKHAAATIVFSWCSNDVPPNVESVDSGSMRFTRPRPSSDTTGVLEADILLQRFRRTQFSGAVRSAG